jgi:threonine/homoserine/homoserine lactone efflux protein
MTLTHLWAFALAATVLIVVPGPSVAFIVGQALARGRRTAAVTVFGNAAGAYLQVAIVALGLGLTVEHSIAVFDAVKLLGAAYLVWLGVRTLSGRRDLAGGLAIGEPVSAPTAFRQGFFVGATNPKTIIFFSAFLPEFVSRGTGSVPEQLLLLGLVYVAIAVASDSIWGLAAGSLREWLRGSPRRMRMVGDAGGLAMIGLGLSIALTGRKD